MEILNHLFGTCGEFHPNVFNVTLLILGLTYLYRQKKTSQSK